MRENADIKKFSTKFSTRFSTADIYSRLLKRAAVRVAQSRRDKQGRAMPDAIAGQRLSPKFVNFPSKRLKLRTISVDKSGNDVPLSGQEGICIQ